MMRALSDESEPVWRPCSSAVKWLIDKLEDELANFADDDATYARRCQEFEGTRKLGWSE